MISLAELTSDLAFYICLLYIFITVYGLTHHHINKMEALIGIKTTSDVHLISFKHQVLVSEATIKTSFSLNLYTEWQINAHILTEQSDLSVN